jgi:hypothetical protein
MHRWIGQRNCSQGSAFGIFIIAEPTDRKAKNPRDWEKGKKGSNSGVFSEKTGDERGFLKLFPNIPFSNLLYVKYFFKNLGYTVKLFHIVYL